ncbi:MAG: citrate lyase beta subunit [Candidatus Levybacteria bacterium]|nr:citrate lyase beta subunit [Candidatus Levybacteria bacterium]
MNTLENKMVKLLIDLRENHKVVELKAEFETEAVRMNELMRLKEVADRAGLGLVIKIGGAEAITDMFEAQHIGVTGLIAPMIESPYAMTKYLEAIKKHFPEDLKKEIHFGVNIETYQGFQNLKEILSVKLIRLIDTVTLGRVDMSGSLGLGRDDINCDQLYEIAQSMFTLAKKKGLRTTMGGGIAVEAIPFIKKLVSKKLLDRFETRKIVFNVPSNFKKVERGIIKANMFELLWLQNKKNYYSAINIEDDNRIEMLRKRIK